jgi:hypothetical protein
MKPNRKPENKEKQCKCDCESTQNGEYTQNQMHQQNTEVELRILIGAAMPSRLEKQTLFQMILERKPPSVV